jgi:hypothetical protein
MNSIGWVYVPSRKTRPSSTSSNRFREIKINGYTGERHNGNEHLRLWNCAHNNGALNHLLPNEKEEPINRLLRLLTKYQERLSFLTGAFCILDTC